jgi:hypothetical protein
MQAGREVARQLLHLGGDFARDLQRVGVGGLIDRDAGGGLAVELEVLAVGLGPHIDARDIPEADEAAALGGLVLDDDVGKFRGIVEPRLDVDGVLECLILRRRRHADLAGRNFLALLPDHPDHVLRHEVE